MATKHAPLAGSLASANSHQLPGFALVLIRIILFLFGLNLYVGSPFEIGWDLTTYLAIAKNIALGHGFINFDGQPATDRPALELILAGALRLTHFSMPAIAWMTFGLNALLGVMLFDLARRLYDWRVGLIAAISFLGSSSLLVRNPQIVDPLWPTFVIASLLLMLSRNLDGRIAAILAALAMAAAGLVKIFALLTVPVCMMAPLIAGVRFAGRRAAWYAIVLALLLGAWFAVRNFWLEGASHVMSDEERLYAFALNRLMNGQSLTDRDVVSLAVGSDSISTGGASLVGIATVAQYLIHGLWVYFAGSDGLYRNLPLAGAPIAAVVLTALRALWTKRANDIIVVALLVVLLPFVGICGALGYRFTQALLFIALFYLASAAILMTIVDRITTNQLVSTGATALLAMAICVSATGKWSYRSIVLGGTGRLEVSTFHEYDKLAPQLMAGVDSGMLVATNNEQLASLLFLRDNASIRVRRLPTNPAEAVDWLKVNKPDRVVVATGQGLGSYPPGVITASDAYRQVSIDDRSRYAFQFFAKVSGAQ
jgi:hypothetical protein